MNDKTIGESLAKRMAFAARERNDVSEDATEFWVCTGDAAKDKWRKVAATVMEIMRPKRLVWHRSDMSGWNGDYHTLPTAYTVRCADENGWKWSCLERGAYGWGQSPEAAQSAAQAHADAAWLASLPLGDLVKELHTVDKTTAELYNVLDDAAFRITELENKLAMAMEALDEAIYLLDPSEEDITKETGLYRIVEAFTELKGER